jgi:acetolactate synthase-1/3 small subunit
MSPAALPATATAVAPDPLHTLSLLVNDYPGVLVRVGLVFARRGYNIESLVVSPEIGAQADSGAIGNRKSSRITVTCRGDAVMLEQIVKQLTKLIDVVHAIDHTGQAVVEVEMALIKLRANLNERTEILQIAEHYNAKVVDYGPQSLILRITGATDKVDSFVSLMQPLGIVELVRSGKILMKRGPETT